MVSGPTRTIPIKPEARRRNLLDDRVDQYLGMASVRRASDETTRDIAYQPMRYEVRPRHWIGQLEQLASFQIREVRIHLRAYGRVADRRATS
jgi:hypothetical protein